VEPLYRILLPGVPVTSGRGALGWCNVVLLRRSGKNILFDTGSYGDRQPLVARLAACGLAPEDIDLVFASHFHYDHVANAEIFACPVAVSERERCYATQAEYLARHDPFVPRALIPFLGARLTGVPEGDEVAPGVRTVALPGHTPGTTGLLLEGEGVLLAGDAVKNAWDFVRGEPPPSFHSRDTAPGNYQRIRELARVVVPGHDRPFELLPGGGVRYLASELEVRLELFADPAQPPSPLTLLAAGEHRN
jgi:glyoxylase-like metal-dependent hydrolase (beta-lactamase superfamily II)